MWAKNVEDLNKFVSLSESTLVWKSLSSIHSLAFCSLLSMSLLRSAFPELSLNLHALHVSRKKFDPDHKLLNMKRTQNTSTYESNYYSMRMVSDRGNGKIVQHVGKENSGSEF